MTPRSVDERGNLTIGEGDAGNCWTSNRREVQVGDREAFRSSEGSKSYLFYGLLGLESCEMKVLRNTEEGLMIKGWLDAKMDDLLFMRSVHSMYVKALPVHYLLKKIDAARKAGFKRGRKDAKAELREWLQSP